MEGANGEPDLDQFVFSANIADHIPKKKFKRRNAILRLHRFVRILKESRRRNFAPADYADKDAMKSCDPAANVTKFQIFLRKLKRRECQCLVYEFFSYVGWGRADIVTVIGNLSHYYCNRRFGPQLGVLQGDLQHSPTCLQRPEHTWTHWQNRWFDGDMGGSSDESEEEDTDSDDEEEEEEDGLQLEPEGNPVLGEPEMNRELGEPEGNPDLSLEDVNPDLGEDDADHELGEPEGNPDLSLEDVNIDLGEDDADHELGEPEGNREGVEQEDAASVKDDAGEEEETVEEEGARAGNEEEGQGEGDPVETYANVRPHDLLNMIDHPKPVVTHLTLSFGDRNADVWHGAHSGSLLRALASRPSLIRLNVRFPGFNLSTTLLNHPRHVVEAPEQIRFDSVKQLDFCQIPVSIRFLKYFPNLEVIKINQRPGDHMYSAVWVDPLTYDHLDDYSVSPVSPREVIHSQTWHTMPLLRLIVVDNGNWIIKYPRGRKVGTKSIK